jgi:flagellar basal body P-ring formation protein FlgA
MTETKALKRMLAFCPALLLLPYASASASDWEDLGALDARVAAMTGAGVGQPSGPSAPIDRRIRLAKCPQAASLEQAGADSLAIRCAALGWRVRVPLMPSVTKTAESSAVLVRRGDVVELVYEGDGFAATSSGTAIDDGPMGKAIRVKTSASGAAVTAIVTGAGAVRIAR